MQQYSIIVIIVTEILVFSLKINGVIMNIRSVDYYADDAPEEFTKSLSAQEVLILRLSTTEDHD